MTFYDLNTKMLIRKTKSYNSFQYVDGICIAIIVKCWNKNGKIIDILHTNQFAIYTPMLQSVDVILISIILFSNKSLC